MIRKLAWGTKLLLYFVVLFCSHNSHAKGESVLTASALDAELRLALLEDNISKFVHLLDEGASPTEWFENSQAGWVLCAATIIGKEEFLLEILERGYDPNYRRTKVTSELSIPLSCAVRSSNLAAIKILVNAGGDPTNSICIKCSVQYQTSVLSEAVLVNKYELAVWLFEHGEYSESMVETVIQLIEFLPFSPDSPEAGNRSKLIHLINVKGYSVVPWENY